MIRITFCIVSLMAILSCSSQTIALNEEVEIREQAEVYAAKFRTRAYGFPPVVVVNAQEGIREVLYFDYSEGYIGHQLYDETLFKQFLAMLQTKKSLSYSKAHKGIVYELHNYYAESCPVVEKALSKIKYMDLTYHHKIPYSRNPDNMSYSYLYIDKDNGNVAHRINTGIAEHPVSEIYRIAKKAIKECPYPKVPKYHKNP